MISFGEISAQSKLASSWRSTFRALISEDCHLPIVSRQSPRSPLRSQISRNLGISEGLSEFRYFLSVGRFLGIYVGSPIRFHNFISPAGDVLAATRWWWWCRRCKVYRESRALFCADISQPKLIEWLTRRTTTLYWDSLPKASHYREGTGSGSAGPNIIK